MQPEDFDRILAADAEIVASSGFTGAVMEVVRREASGLLPIPFPWQRAWPGLVVVGLAMAALVLLPLLTRSAGGVIPSGTQVTAILAPFLETMRRFGVNWLLAALLLSWTCVKLSMGLASWRS